ncbi:MAG: glycosyltransferase family 9 protein [Flavobacteriaceae bacterium]|nr:glycosyltransferase family 9 protein [Bacteroidia bacterium]NNK82445.1 glycosyltransferase family 9 protein [Flavobacteriaceae bacterium]
MGDVAMIVPVLRALNNQYPEVKITVLTRAFFAPFFRDLKYVSIYKADVKGRHKGVHGLYKLSKELKLLSVDAVADLHNVLRSNLLKLFFVGTPFFQINKGRAKKKALTTGKDFKQLKTTHQRYADVFEKLGFTLSLKNPVFPEKAKLDSYISEVIDSNSKPMIGIAPFAAFKSKAYPIALMEEVIKDLSKEYKILLFGGGKKETVILNQIADKNKNTINLAGKLNLNQELDVISNLKVMIAMDSGNAHMAAMLGTQVVTLWGVTHPYAGFYPFNQNPDNALLANQTKYPKIPTSIYGNKYPEGYEDAIASITPKQVVEKTLKVIKKA